MPAIEPLGPSIYGKFSINSNNNRKDLYRYGIFCNRFRVSRQEQTRFSNKSTSFWPVNVYRHARVSRSFDGFDLWGGFLRNQGRRESRIRANGSREQDTDSKAGSGEKGEAKGGESKGGSKKSASSSSSPRRRERNKGKVGGGRAGSGGGSR